MRYFQDSLSCKAWFKGHLLREGSYRFPEAPSLASKLLQRLFYVPPRAWHFVPTAATSASHWDTRSLAGPKTQHVLNASSPTPPHPESRIRPQRIPPSWPAALAPQFPLLQSSVRPLRTLPLPPALSSDTASSGKPEPHTRQGLSPHCTSLLLGSSFQAPPATLVS